MPEKPSLAIIGGSGLYHMAGLTSICEQEIITPFGKPSAPIITGELDGKPIAFLARHGVGHTLTPGEVPYRANIYALKTLGVERVISINACGSLREDFAPGQIIIPDQLYDNTRNRARSFFGEGLVAHAGVADPFCDDLSLQLEKAVEETGAVVHQGGSFVIIEGPRFSTRAESNVFRSWGMSIVGMTASPEAFLAREAELCYAVMAHVTDFDVWHISEAPVTVEMVIKVLNQNVEVAQKAIRNLIKELPDNCSCECKNAMATALITQRDLIPTGTRKKLDLLIGKYL